MHPILPPFLCVGRKYRIVSLFGSTCNNNYDRFRSLLANVFLSVCVSQSGVTESVQADLARASRSHKRFSPLEISWWQSHAG